MSAKQSPLPAKAKLFAMYYARSLDMEKAGDEAGYKGKNDNRIIKKLLKDDRMKDLITEESKINSSQKHVTRQMVEAGLYRIAQGLHPTVDGEDWRSTPAMRLEALTLVGQMNGYISLQAGENKTPDGVGPRTQIYIPRKNTNKKLEVIVEPERQIIDID